MNSQDKLPQYTINIVGEYSKLCMQKSCIYSIAD